MPALRFLIGLLFGVEGSSLRGTLVPCCLPAVEPLEPLFFVRAGAISESARRKSAVIFFFLELYRTLSTDGYVRLISLVLIVERAGRLNAARK